MSGANGESDSSDRHAKGGVEIESTDGKHDLYRVTMYCEGCGEEMEEIAVLSDVADRLEEDDPQPIHDSHECREAATDALGMEEA